MSVGVPPRGDGFSRMKGTASTRNPATPSWSQKPMIRRVVDDEVEEHPHATASCLVDELDEVAERAEPRVDPVKVGDVVAVVPVRRRLAGLQPECIDAQALQVVEPAAESLEV